MAEQDPGTPLSLDVAILTNNPQAPDICQGLLVAHGIPEGLHSGLTRYLVSGVRPGSYLCAVLANDLLESTVRAADQAHVLALPRLMRFLYNYAPGASWGDPGKVDAWCAGRRERRV